MPVLVLGKTTVIVLRRTAVFVTRKKHVLVARARDQGWSPAQTIIAPAIKFEAYYRYGRFLTRSFLGIEIAPSFSVRERTVSMDSHSF